MTKNRHIISLANEKPDILNFKTKLSAIEKVVNKLGNPKTEVTNGMLDVLGDW